jgi:hypothetical protein
MSIDKALKVFIVNNKIVFTLCGDYVVVITKLSPILLYNSLLVFTPLLCMRRIEVKGSYKLITHFGGV